MSPQAVSSGDEVYRYTKHLLDEKTKELQGLESRHRCKLLDAQNYAACRRALAGAIDEIKEIVSALEQPNHARNGELKQSGGA